MTLEALAEILKTRYGLCDIRLQFLREGGSQTWLAEGTDRYLIKRIGAAFAATSRQSVSIMRFLEERGFPVPKTLLTRTGDALAEVSADGETHLIVVQEWIDGGEPDLRVRAAEVGALVGRLHCLLDQYPGTLISRDRQFFIGRYLDFLRQKGSSRLSEYEDLGERLWERVARLPMGNCHGDLHRGNLLEDAKGQIYLLDFDAVCRAPIMFDVMVMCDMTDYFRLNQADISLTKEVWQRFLPAYTEYRSLSPEEERSFCDWVAIRHFQLQATILELYGIDCIDERFIEAQLHWLKRWMQETGEWVDIV